MLIIATFEHTTFLELAITEIENKCIPKPNILATPLQLQQQNTQILDTIHRADGISQIDSAFLAAAFMSVIFTIFGSIWYGGPLLWGTLGMFVGGGIGLAIDTFHTKKYRSNIRQSISGEVVMVINCEESHALFIEKTLVDHLALGIARVEGSHHRYQGKP